jgi:hypothetical protein
VAPELKQRYEVLLVLHCLESDDDEDTRKRLTEEQIAGFYEQLEVMHKAVLLGVEFCTAVG